MEGMYTTTEQAAHDLSQLSKEILGSVGQAYTNPPDGWDEREQRYDRVVIGETLAKMSAALNLLAAHEAEGKYRIPWSDVIDSFREVFRYGQRWFPHVKE